MEAKRKMDWGFVEEIANFNDYYKEDCGCKDCLTRDIATRAMEAQQLLRHEWWINHGCDGVRALYGDDGEMQCNACVTDFKRMGFEALQQKVQDTRAGRFRREAAKFWPLADKLKFMSDALRSISVIAAITPIETKVLRYDFHANKEIVTPTQGSTALLKIFNLTKSALSNTAPEAPPSLSPKFIDAMADIGRSGYEKYKEQSFQHRRLQGDTSRGDMERTTSKGLVAHVHAHLAAYLGGEKHDHFGTLRHQLAAAAFNIMMECFFAGLEDEESANG